jgi:hypothetical protein
VNFRILIQTVDVAQQRLFTEFSVVLLQNGIETAIFTGFYFIADIDLRSRLSPTRMTARLVACRCSQGSCAVFYFCANLLGEFVSVNDLSSHDVLKEDGKKFSSGEIISDQYRLAGECRAKTG